MNVLHLMIGQKSHKMRSKQEKNQEDDFCNKGCLKKKGNQCKSNSRKEKQNANKKSCCESFITGMYDKADQIDADRYCGQIHSMNDDFIRMRTLKEHIQVNDGTYTP